jgi:hypothetical protein
MGCSCGTFRNEPFAEGNAHLPPAKNYRRCDICHRNLILE